MDNAGQNKTVQDFQNRTETGQTNHDSKLLTRGRKNRHRLPKTHQDYWYSRVSKRSYLSRDGSTKNQVPTWQVRLFHQGREGWFNLDTANQAKAAVKARDIYVFLRANGWDATLAKYKAGQNETAPPRLKQTVGEYLQAVRDCGQLRLRTFLGYQNSFRTILSEIFGIRPERGQSKFDYRSKESGQKRWAERIDNIRLQRVTPDRIGKWKRDRLRRAGNSPVALAATKRTINSYIRNARSLFSPHLLKQLKHLHLPNPLPFAGVEMEEAGSSKYISKMNVQALIVAAKTQLKEGDPEAYKVFLLALFAALRKREIDLLEWQMMDWSNSVIRLEQTQWLHLKTADSAGAITVDQEVIVELREFQSKSQSPFVVTSDVIRGKKKKRVITRQPRSDSALAYYRCEPVFSRLNAWLRSKGVTASKPLHELRKEVGALIATEHGIYAASRFLRHSDITTTARHYADQKARISVGLGKLLNTPWIGKSVGQEAAR